MNRAQRRRLAAQADRAAHLLASATFDRAPDGRLAHVAHPRAQRALARAFAHLIRHDHRSHLTRIAPQDAAAFPSPAEVPDGWAAWLAVGVDRDGRGTFVLRSVRVEGAADATHERRMVEARLLGELRPLLEERWAMPGPVPTPRPLQEDAR